eukprot:Blabericola_migrator_1__8168@NODE_421_length_8666_cov_158_657053_g333_i0_p3_GENE_NODE_421_length_8666_cov_158_657053_g333_i0NODE_421_length_8666_cov_158_657053_g333_i0_p3_ORF_typecomplete_len589_score131_81Thioredoxin/PF00085_20/3_7e12Thioredoxin/PF00085_20/4_4e03Thioredoxin/PF00085_20/7_7e20Thioredoxin_6/PF13848_6/61Thioredoxin_6/PF13848_6/0_075Thioredoxin_6/PF13848_6/4_6e06Thioredoxin_6/PF13848_6/0_012TraF/PF13728_6/2e05TraF/PF13728_6/3_2e03TraF/PF13728_6/1_2e03TraF/PF13728_6/0_0098Thioredoxin
MLKGVVLAVTIVLFALGKIEELSSQTHDRFIKDNQHAVVLYYVPWCHWCQRFLPIYQEIAVAADKALKSISSEGGNPVYGAINVDLKSNRDIAKVQGIFQYPTLILHDSIRASSERFEGEFKLPSVLKWIMDKTTSDLSITSPEQLNVVLELHHNDVILLTANPDEKMIPILNQLMTKFSDVMFGTLNGPIIIDHVLDMFDKEDIGWVTDDHAEALYFRDHPGVPFTVLLNPHHHNDGSDKFTYDKTHYEYYAHLYPRNHSLHNATQLSDFISTYQFPTVSRFTPSVAMRLVPSGKNFLVAFMRLPQDVYEIDEGMQATDPRLLFVEDYLWAVAGKNRHKMVTLMSGVDHFYERRFLGTLNIENTPELIYATVQSGEDGNGIKARYHAPEELKELIFLEQVADIEPDVLKRRLAQATELFDKWIEGIENGSIEPSLKSEEPIPESDNAGPVRYLCAKTFEQEVYQSNVDMVVDFYAPWCGHCRVMSPIYERVAKAFEDAGVTHIKFAKIDATANELPSITLRGYPTVALFGTRNKRTPYMMSRPVNKPNDLIDFVSQVASKKFDLKRVRDALAHPKEDADLPKLVEEL